MSMTESEAIEWLAEDTSPTLIHIAEMKKENPMVYINEAVKVACDALSEIQQYRAIGTVSEFRELKEKATAKKPYYVYSDEPLCPYCHMILDGCEEHCECGQKLDWREGKE